MDRKQFPGKMPAVRLYFSLYPEGNTINCVRWIMEQYGVKVRSKRVSTIRKQLKPGTPITRSETMTVPKTDEPTTDNTNGEAEGTTPTKRLQLTHGEFYKVCQTLSTHAEEFLEKRYTRKEAQVRLGELTGFRIGEHTIADLMEATGVKWEPKRASVKNKKMRDFAVRTLTTALFRLYRKHKEEVPKALLDLYEEETGRRPNINTETDEKE